MAIEAITMYVARCDAPGCMLLSSDVENGNNRVYETVAELKKQFGDTVEGNLADEHSWLRVVEPGFTAPAGPVEKHYCGKHTTWDDATDRRIPALGDLVYQSQVGAIDEPSSTDTSLINTESETA